MPRALGQHSPVSDSVAVAGLVELAAYSALDDRFLVRLVLVGVAAMAMAACLAFTGQTTRPSAAAAE